MHGPLPWLGKCELAASDIEQVYCERVSGGNREKPRYVVTARFKSGRRAPLLSTLWDLEQARYIEQEIESYFEIADSYVDGEFRSGPY